MKPETKKIIWTVSIIIVILLASAIFINKAKTANAIRESEEQKSLENMFSNEECRCLENERTKCSNGFELMGGICKNETLKIFTNVLRGCSEYSCENEGYIFNSTIQKWEIKK